MDYTLLNHFPHSFDCEKSIEMAKKHLKIIAEFDPNLAMRFANELKSKVIIGNRMVEFI